MNMRRCLLALTLLPCFLVANEEALPPPFQEQGEFSSELWSLFTTLGLIIFFLILAAWALRRMMATRVQQLNESSAIKVLERRAIAPKLAIYLLEVAGQGIVISEASNGVKVLATLPPGTDLSELGLGEDPEELTQPRSQS